MVSLQATLQYWWRVTRAHQLQCRFEQLGGLLHDPSTAPRAIVELIRKLNILRKHEEAIPVITGTQQMLTEKADGIDKISVEVYDTVPALAEAEAEELYDEAMKARDHIAKKFGRSMDKALPVDLGGPIEIRQLLSQLAEVANNTLVELNSPARNLNIVANSVQSMAAMCHTLHELMETPPGAAWACALDAVMDLVDELPALDAATQALAITSTVVLVAVAHLNG
ncbi:hypothetical protein HYH03_009112 [Edaphochlamys debaryana]|uniref:Uncharacterized protein n=1 Tax=Edaphochlamys debaryana TaxID=47281 RepID=A0A836BYX1_9CHLO|nr:hypothetical protein HYH03_009112 [Edaphochlamys debaryana]|eukprot:KAG2492699.1 hypothetical protein HYH03_009112 [Edaphochlamys debaryana]